MFFPELLIEATDSTLRIKVTGPRSALDRLKQYLTITNTSVSWQIREVNKKLLANRVRGISDDSTYSQYHLKQLAELLPLETEELYFDEGTHLILPAGFFYLAKNATDFMDNKDVVPYYLPHLRDYQKQAVRQILTYKRGGIQAPTGTGKTSMVASLVLSLVKSGKRVMVVVPSEYLVGQVYNTISKYHDSVTAAGGGRHPALGKDVIVVTAMSAKKYASSYPAVIVDESQHLSAATWQDLLTANEEVEYVYSCSATPFRNDGLDLMIQAVSGKEMFSMTVRKAIEDGWLCKPLIYQVSVSTNLRFEGNAIKAYKTLVQDPKVFGFMRDKVAGGLAQGHKILIIFKTVIAAKAFSKFCKGCDYQVAHGEYKKPLHDFAAGKIDVLLASSQLVSEGVDIPNTSMLIVVSNHSSDITSYQAIGRVLRNAEGKEHAIVLDVAVEGFRQFENAAKKRLAVYKEITDNVFKLKI